MTCKDCGKAVPDREAWPEYAGLARPRSQRGQDSGSSLVDRKPTGAIVCTDCAMDRINGVNPAQEKLG